MSWSIRRFRYKEAEAAFSILEFAIIIPVMLILLMGIFDIINLIRAQGAVKEAAFYAAEFASKFDFRQSGTDNGSHEEQAKLRGVQQLLAVFPATRFPCSDDGPSCLRIELNSDSSSSQAAVTFNLPFLLLSSEPIEISSTATVRSQATYLPSDSMIVINQTDGSDDD